MMTEAQVEKMLKESLEREERIRKVVEKVVNGNGKHRPEPARPDNESR